MMLLVDAGNTRVKWALADAAAPGNWSAHGAVPQEGMSQCVPQWQGLPLARVLVSNVAGAAMAARIAAALAAASVRPEAIEWFGSVPARAGVVNGYRQPASLGCDRFAALIGARHRFPDEPLLVVGCGTATTIDALDANGRFTGGMILPGAGLMAHALAQRTAQLPAVDAAAPTAIFADNTEDAIASGCLHAQAGAIALARQALPGARCVLSGGAADAVAPLLAPPVERIDHLVLLGLHVAALSEAG